MTQEKEKYYFFKLYTVDFDSAKHILQVLKRYRRKDVRYCILRDLIVTYCRPFSGNKGDKITNHKLTIEMVPIELRPLHKELLDFRNQLFAHTDYTYRQPKVVNWSTDTYKWFPMAFRGFDYGKLDNRVSQISELIQNVEMNLQARINTIEESIEQHL